MGNCCGVLKHEAGKYAEYIDRPVEAVRPTTQRRDTPADAEARVRAAEAAAARQQKFETSAVGKAVTKAVKEAKAKPQVQHDERSSAQASSNARDWLT